jgi:membrane-associated protease RseP (regulator of RpoE activity)
VALAYLLPAAFWFVSYTLEGVGGGLLLEPVPGHPADTAGLRAGDRAVEVNGEAVGSFAELKAAVDRSGAPNVELTIERDGQRHTLVIPKDDGRSRIGVRSLEEALPPGYALGQALATPARILTQYCMSLIEVFRGRQQVGLVGPVSVARLAGGTTRPWTLMGGLSSLQFGYSLVFYTLVLVLDVRARLGYQRRVAR